MAYTTTTKNKLECPNYKTVCVRIMRYEIINNENKGKKKKDNNEYHIYACQFNNKTNMQFQSSQSINQFVFSSSSMH